MSIRWLVPIAAASWRRLRSAIPVSRAWPTAAARRRSRACEVAIPECTIWYVYQLVHKEGQMRRISSDALEGAEMTASAVVAAAADEELAAAAGGEAAGA